MVTRFSALIILASARLMTAFAASTIGSWRVSAIGSKAAADKFGIELDPAAGKPMRIDDAGQHDRIGDRRILAAAAVASGAGIGARALRADLETAILVNAGDRPSARADFNDVNDRNLQWIAGI